MVSKSNAFTAFNDEPVIVKLALSVSPVPATNAYVKASPILISVAVKFAIEAPTVLFSFTVLAEIAILVGAVFLAS